MHSRYINVRQKLLKCYFALAREEKVRLFFSNLKQSRTKIIAMVTKFFTSLSLSELVSYMYKLLTNSAVATTDFNFQ